jgi:16S rRNA (guanine527-N7)-methyltransferase
MLEWGGHLLAPEGEWLALKGRVPQDEVAAMPEEFRIERTIRLDVPGLDADRHLVVIKRARAVAKTDDEGQPRTS